MVFKLGVFYIFFVFISAIGFMNHVISIPLILQAAGRDAWLSVILTIVPFTFYLILLYIIAKSIYPMHFFDWCEAKVGRPLTIGIVSIFAIHFFGLSFLTFLDTVNWSIITYLPQTPKWIIALFLACLCLYTAKSGIRTIVILNGILLPFVLIFGFFVMSANIPKKEASLLLPILEHGYKPVLAGMMYTITPLFEMIVLLFLLHHLKKRVSFLSLLITGIILIYLTFGPTMGSITEFGYVEATKQRYPAYDQWGLLSIGLFLEHVDFLSIYQWLSGATIRISLFSFLIPEILHLKKERTRFVTLLLLFIAMVLLVFVPISDVQFLHFLSHYYFPYAFLIVSLFTLFFTFLALKGGEKHDVSK